MRTATIDESDAALPRPPAHDPARATPLLEAIGSVPRRILLFLVLFALSWLGVYLSNHADGVATIWFSNGLLFAIVIRKPRRTWPLYAAIGVLADCLVGDPVAVAIGVSLANSVEVFLSAYLLSRRFGTPMRLSRPGPLFGFLCIAVLAAPALTGALAARWLMVFYPSSWETTARTWYLGDAIGMAILDPLVFTLQEPGFFAKLGRREIAKTLIVLTTPALATAVAFGQSKEPLMFIIFPALIYVVFRLGFPGATMAICIVACIAIPLTVTGHGTMMLSTGTGMLHKIVVVQIFLAVALVTAFPIAAMLEERTALELALQQRETQFRELANTDALTGQANRRAFDERLEAEWQRSAEHGTSLALLSLDVDLFKSYNDIYGHIAGDDCLRRIASLAAEALHQGTSARLYRLGGEEFAIILPNANADEALGLGERIRQAVVTAQIDHAGSPNGRQTLSIGVAAAIATPGRPAFSLLAISDQALYNAKHNGRNRCEAAT